VTYLQILPRSRTLLLPTRAVLTMPRGILRARVRFSKRRLEPVLPPYSPPSEPFTLAATIEKVMHA